MRAEPGLTNPVRAETIRELHSPMWACGAAGSALPWHGRGHRFDPDQVHQATLSESMTYRTKISAALVQFGVNWCQFFFLLVCRETRLPTWPRLAANGCFPFDALGLRNSSSIELTMFLTPSAITCTYMLLLLGTRAWRNMPCVSFIVPFL